MNNNIKILANHLEQEIIWIEELNLLLTEEKTILATRQFDVLEELANKKQALSDQIEKSASQRVELISQSNPGANLSIKEFLKDCTTEESNLINKLNKKLAELLTTCRELNNVNGQVIVNNMHTREQIVRALSGNNADAVSVYTATGSLQSSSENNHHQEA